MSLTEFLLARIAEDEKAAWRFRPPASGRVDPEGCGCTDCLVGYSRPADDLTNPRVLIECDAKRQIVLMFAMSAKNNLCSIDDLFCGDTVRLLALPYADHPDYRQEWKP